MSGIFPAREALNVLRDVSSALSAVPSPWWSMPIASDGSLSLLLGVVAEARHA
jgi:hypothetical protein